MLIGLVLLRSDMLVAIQIFGLIAFCCRADATSSTLTTAAPENPSDQTKSKSVLALRSGSSSGPSNDEKQKAILELANDLAMMIAQDVQIAQQTYNEKGKGLTEHEKADFFNEVGMDTLQRIYPTVKQLNRLEPDKEEMVKVIGKKIGKELSVSLGKSEKVDTKNFVRAALKMTDNQGV